MYMFVTLGSSRFALGLSHFTYKVVISVRPLMGVRRTSVMAGLRCLLFFFCFVDCFVYNSIFPFNIVYLFPKLALLIIVIKTSIEILFIFVEICEESVT